MFKTQIFTLVSVLTIGTVAMADTANEAEQECVVEAKSALAAKIRKPVSDIAFHTGARLGDGASSIQVSLYQVKGRSGFYKVELNAEDCSVRNFERINN